MRAIQMSEFGGPEVLELVELPLPTAGPEEVLIKVTRAGLNFADTHQRTNSYVQKATLPMIPGSEVAGVREDSGERVVALTGGAGGYAEYASAPKQLVFGIPDGLDDGTALAMIIQGTTAWHLYRTSARVAPGESVVIHGAAGGVGSIAVQLGHQLGAGRVIATASSEEKRALALELGADAALDPARGGAGRAAARGERPASRSTSSSRCPAARCSTRPTRRSHISGGSSCAGSRRASRTRCAAARCCATRAR